MARWNKTLKENSINILNEVICNGVTNERE